MIFIKIKKLKKSIHIFGYLIEKKARNFFGNYFLKTFWSCPNAFWGLVINILGPL